jgi:hypothetical protein
MGNAELGSGSTPKRLDRILIEIAVGRQQDQPLRLRLSD